MAALLQGLGMPNGPDSQLWTRGIHLHAPQSFAHIHPDVLIETPSDITAQVAFFTPFRLGAFSHLNGGSIQNVTIGRYCSFARGIMIGQGFHPQDWLSVSALQIVTDYRGWAGHMGAVGRPRQAPTQPFVSEIHTRIGNDVWLGANVIVKDGIEIGDGAIVGAGSVVTKNVEPYSVVVGNPARLLRYRFPPDVIERLQRLQWWRYIMTDFEGIDFSRIDQAVDTIERLIEGGLQPFDGAPVDAEELTRLVADAGASA